MSSVTPGRETDAAVARALGKSICPHEECNDAECDADLVAHASDGMLHRGDMPGSPVWSPSTVEADAISALEATGKDYTHRKLIGRHLVWFASVPSEGVPFATLCLAACAAILAWAEAKGSSK